jgi:RNA polymerase sigma-70 factor (ECF subfamily)
VESQNINIHHDLIQACLETKDNPPDKAKKRKAQCELYKLYYKAMYNTALRIVNDSSEAEDIIQNSFLDAFSKLHTLSGTGTFGSWLKRIVINNSIDALRQQREFKLMTDEELEIPESHEIDSSVEIEAKVEEVKNAMKQLSNDDRIILSLFLLEGYDHEEISYILKISYNACRTRYSRARQRLCNSIKMQRSHYFKFN